MRGWVRRKSRRCGLGICSPNTIGAHLGCTRLPCKSFPVTKVPSGAGFRTVTDVTGNSGKSLIWEKLGRCDSHLTERAETLRQPAAAARFPEPGDRRTRPLGRFEHGGGDKEKAKECKEREGARGVCGSLACGPGYNRGNVSNRRNLLLKLRRVDADSSAGSADLGA